MKKHFLKALLGLAIIFGVSTNAGAQLGKLTKKKAPAKTADKDTNASAEPDKVLYDRALADIKHGRYTEGRLSLQTLINTYPDSEYLAKAKLAVADSYFKEGGTSNLTQSVAEYKDFITFFPFLEESAYAQMQVGMAHYKMMEKADRDSSQAQMAEDEFQAMLLKFPQSPLAPQAEQRLREVQEVLADGEYKIAHYYYTKQDYRASAARLLEVINRYPLYSQSDESLWLLGDIYTRVKQGSKNEDLRNYWSALSGKVYDQIVTQYPLSTRAPDAKARLKQMGMPIPPPNPEALARMQKEREFEKQHHQSAIVKGPMNMIHGAPDVTMAAHVGQPNLNPPDDAVAASEVLKPNAGVTGFTLSGSTAAPGADAAVAGNPDAPVKQEDAVSTGTVESGAASGVTFGVQLIQPPVASTTAATDPAPGTRADASANSGTSSPAGAASTGTSTGTSAAAQPAANQTDTGAGTTTSTTTTTTTTGGSADSTASAPASSGSGASARPFEVASTTSQTDQGSTDSSSNSTNQSASSPQTPTDDSKDSTSKKKKGIRKVIPW